MILYADRMMSGRGKRIGRETIYGPEQVAALAGVQVDTVSRWRNRGIMVEPDVTISRVPIWREATIVRWLEETGRLPEGHK